MAGERELTTGLLSKDASFRLVVTGQVGVKEIERLIQKLTLDKEILADTDSVSEGEGEPMDSAPRNNRMILIYGRLSPTPDAPFEWILGRFVNSTGWCAGADDSALVQIHDPKRWKRYFA